MVGLGAVTWGQVVTGWTCNVAVTMGNSAVQKQPLRAIFFRNQCLCAGLNSSGKAFGTYLCFRVPPSQE